MTGSSYSYPNMANVIANLNDPLIVQKLPKEALQGNLQEIAINSMNDLTGVVASLLGRTRAIGAENIVLEIPAGGRQSEPKEMRILDFLSQELQIAVDSLKIGISQQRTRLKCGMEFPWWSRCRC